MQHEFSWFFKKNFPKYQKKVISVPGFLNSRTWMPLKTSVVIFQALKALAVSLILAASATSLATKASTTLFPQITSWYWWSDHCHQNDQYWTFVCGMDYQKPNFSLINGTLSDGGSWGQPMFLFWKLVDETQMPKPQEYTDTFSLIKNLFLVALRGLQKISNLVERPCTTPWALTLVVCICVFLILGYKIKGHSTTTWTKFYPILTPSTSSGQK